MEPNPIPTSEEIADGRYNLNDLGRNVDMQRDVLLDPDGEAVIGFRPNVMRSWLDLHVFETGWKVRLHWPMGKVVTIEEYLDDGAHAAPAKGNEGTP